MSTLGHQGNGETVGQLCPLVCSAIPISAYPDLRAYWSTLKKQFSFWRRQNAFLLTNSIDQQTNLFLEPESYQQASFQLFLVQPLTLCLTLKAIIEDSFPYTRNTFSRICPLVCFINTGPLERANNSSVFYFQNIFAWWYMWLDTRVSCCPQTLQ